MLPLSKASVILETISHTWAALDEPIKVVGYPQLVTSSKKCPVATEEQVVKC